MLTYDLDESSSVSLYEQLYNYIKQDILSGELPENSKLPSKRSIASQMSISVITVENAYNQLLSEGFIYSLPRKGFYVSEIGDYYADSRFGLHNTEQYSSGLHNSRDNLTANLKTDLNTSSDFIDFTNNATDPNTFPFATWAKITRRILSDDQELLLTNPPSNGLIELRSSISQYLHDFRGINVNPDNIIIGAGTETIYSLLIQLLGHDKIYGVEDPGYDKIALTINSNNVKCIRIPLDDSGVIPSLLEANKVNIIHTTPSHHFPTGITMPIKRRYELLNGANKADDRYIIEDDYDSEFRLSGRPIPSLYSIDTNEKVIYMNTFTKSLASTIRISYMVLPDHLANEYHHKLSFYSCTVPNYEQLALAKFISEGFYEKHINRMRNISRKKRDLILNCIKKGPLASISDISEEQSGLHFILKLELTKNENDFRKACEQNNIRITSVSDGAYMINYSSISLDKIQEAVQRLTKAAL
jgi:GntR family transcriptional regulator/MocR family aminotransferase